MSAVGDAYRDARKEQDSQARLIAAMVVHGCVVPESEKRRYRELQEDVTSAYDSIMKAAPASVCSGFGSMIESCN